MADMMTVLSAEQTDLLRGLTDVGMGNAATALSTMINTGTDISIPDVKLIKLEDATRLLSAISGGALTMLINISGDIYGKLIHIIPAQFAERVISTYYEKKLSSWADLNEMDESVIFEMTNIISAQFCNALSDQLGMLVDISTPERCQNLAESVAKDADEFLVFVNTVLRITENGSKEFAVFIPGQKYVAPIAERIKRGR